MFLISVVQFLLVEIWLKMSKFSNLSFEEILNSIDFLQIEVLQNDDGKHYVLHTKSYGSSPTCKTIHELRNWIETKLGWQIINKCRE